MRSASRRVASVRTPDSAGVGRQEGARDRRADADDDALGAEQSRRGEQVDEVACGRRVGAGEPGEVDDDDASPAAGDGLEGWPGERPGGLVVELAEHGDHQDALPDIEHRHRQAPDLRLLLADDVELRAQLGLSLLDLRQLVPDHQQRRARRQLDRRQRHLDREVLAGHAPVHPLEAVVAALVGEAVHLDALLARAAARRAAPPARASPGAAAARAACRGSAASPRPRGYSR